jgi:hypothetical protein
VAAAVVLHRVAVAAWLGVAVAVTWLDGGCGRWWQRQSRSHHGGGGSRATSFCGGCMVWRLQSHGLMVAMVGGGCGGHGHVTEAAAVMLHCVAVAAWQGGCGHGHIA